MTEVPGILDYLVSKDLEHENPEIVDHGERKVAFHVKEEKYKEAKKEHDKKVKEQKQVEEKEEQQKELGEDDLII